MKTIELTEIISKVSDSPLRTVKGHAQACQIGGLMQRGKRGRYGGADMCESDCVNLLLAASLNHPRGEGVAKSVKRIRSLKLRHVVTLPEVPNDELEPRIRTVFGFVNGLSIANPLIECGDALESIVRDMRDGTFDKWAGDDYVDVTATFLDLGRSVLISIHRKAKSGPSRQIALSFMPGSDLRKSIIEKSVTWNTAIFRRLAEALGPIET